jgi:hypothetical protein
MSRIINGFEEIKVFPIEAVIFCIIHYILIFIRGSVAIYFIKKSLMYSKLNGVKEDKFTKKTLYFLGAVQILFTIEGFWTVTRNLLNELEFSGYLSADKIQFFKQHYTLIIIIRSFINEGFGYLLQNLAYLANIYRWKILLNSLNNNEMTA